MSNINDFTEIFKEIKRQFKIITSLGNSHDTKIGIFLGFIVVVLG